MGRIFVTGDTHGEMGMNRLSSKNWPLSSELTKDDYVIILGDFGLIFSPTPTPSEVWWLTWLSNKPWTTLIIDGNHDNHWRLNDLPRVERFNGIVGQISENIFHLRRGEIYNINNKKILTFGGATSIDKKRRTEGASWWAEEVPNYKDMANCIENMNNHQNSVDIIFAHTCPQVIAPTIANQIGCTPIEDPTQKMLDHIISVCKFQHFFCGHWHENISYGKYHFLYTKIVNIDEIL